MDRDRCSSRVGVLPMAIAAGVLLLATISSAIANPATAGTAVDPANTAGEVGPSAIPDGAGGAFVAFKVPAKGEFHVAQVDATGTPVPGWNPIGFGGMGLDPYRATQMVPAGPGRVWVMADNTLNSYLARKIGADGLTSPDTTVFASQQYVANSVVALGDGRAMLASRGVANNQAFTRVAIIRSDATLTEVPDIPFAGNWNLYENPTPVLTADGAGGAWVLGEVYNVSGSSGDDLVIARIGPDGVPLLSPGYRVVCALAQEQTDGVLESDDAQGVYVAWADRRNLALSSDLYAKRLLPDGSMARGWGLQGTAIASLPGDQFQPSIASDGAGGLWIAWTDSRTGVNDIYFTRYTANGTRWGDFEAGGRPLCTATGSQVDVQISADGNGGFYAVWRDARDGGVDLYAQHIHATGVVYPGWAPDGLPICTEATEQRSPGVVVVSPGHALATWVDTRTGNTKVYAAALPPDGPIAGVPQPAQVALELSATRNPARDAVELVLSSVQAGPVAVVLRDVSGRLISERVVEGPVRGAHVGFAAGALRPGLYFVTASSTRVSTTTRVSLVR